MIKTIKGIGATVSGTILIALLLVIFAAVVGAYPTKWLLNYVLSPSAIYAVFGVLQLGFWKALAVNITVGLFRAKRSKS